MSWKYDNYLFEHRKGVRDALKWMKENISDVVTAEGWINAQNAASVHDASKDSTEEYMPYDAYFYGGNRSYKVVNDFKYAWLHHIHNNPHHWQYWVLINDDAEEGTVALEMPVLYALEMIADWWSFSWTKGELMEIFSWYDDHKERMILHKNTRKLVETILAAIKKKLEERPAIDD